MYEKLNLIFVFTSPEIVYKTGTEDILFLSESRYPVVIKLGNFDLDDPVEYDKINAIFVFIRTEIVNKT